MVAKTWWDIHCGAAPDTHLVQIFHMTESILCLKNGILLERAPEKLAFNAMISDHGILLDPVHALYLLLFAYIFGG